MKYLNRNNYIKQVLNDLKKSHLSTYLHVTLKDYFFEKKDIYLKDIHAGYYYGNLITIEEKGIRVKIQLTSKNNDLDNSILNGTHEIKDITVFYLIERMTDIYESNNKRYFNYDEGCFFITETTTITDLIHLGFNQIEIVLKDYFYHHVDTETANILDSLSIPQDAIPSYIQLRIEGDEQMYRNRNHPNWYNDDTKLKIYLQHYCVSINAYGAMEYQEDEKILMAYHLFDVLDHLKVKDEIETNYDFKYHDKTINFNFLSNKYFESTVFTEIHGTEIHYYDAKLIQDIKDCKTIVDAIFIALDTLHDMKDMEYKFNEYPF